MDQMQQPDAQQILLGLKSENSEVVRNSAFAAGEEGLVEAVEPLRDLIIGSNIGVQEAAEYALRKIRGSKAVHALLPLLRSDDAPVRNIAMDVLREIGGDDVRALQTWMHDAEADMRIFISDILGSTGSRQAVPLLCEALLKDPEVNVRYQAAVSLGSLAYPEAVDSLRQAMHDEEWVQFSVVEALTKIRADSTVNALVLALSTSSELVSSMIIEALGEMGNVKAVPLLFKSLDKASSPLRHRTVKSIVQILGGRSLSLLSQKDQQKFKTYLLDALDDESESILLAALSGLAVMGGEEGTRAAFGLAVKYDPELNPEIVEAIVNTVASIGYNDDFGAALRSFDEKVVSAALYACEAMNDHRVMEICKEAFWSWSRDLQRLAAKHMAMQCQEEDLEFFEDILDKHDDGDVLKSALYFVGVRMRRQEAINKVFNMLEHSYDDVKEAAIEACIAMGSDEVKNKFKEFFRNEDSMKRMLAVYALGRLGVDESLAELTEALEDESLAVRQLAVEAFAQNGDVCEGRLELLLPRLSDESSEVRTTMVELLGHCSGSASMPYLISALQDSDDWVKIRAVEALGNLKAEEAAPQLVQLFEDASPMLTFKIIDALGNIGGNIAFRSLLGLMDHEDPEIQQAAAEAVSRIKGEQE